MIAYQHGNYTRAEALTANHHGNYTSAVALLPYQHGNYTRAVTLIAFNHGNLTMVRAKAESLVYTPAHMCNGAQGYCHVMGGGNGCAGASLLTESS